VAGCASPQKNILGRGGGELSEKKRRLSSLAGSGEKARRRTQLEGSELSPKNGLNWGGEVGTAHEGEEK